MARNYNRKYKLIIGNPPYKKSITTTPIIVPPLLSKSGTGETIPQYTTTTIPQDAIEITELQMTANITKGVKGDEVSSFTLNNCHEDTIAKAQKEHAIVMLFAGYEDDLPDLPLIYSGQITSAVEESNGTENVLKIQCKGAADSLKTKVSVNYPAGSKVKDVIVDLAKRIPNTVVGVTALDFLGDHQINNGLSLYGNIGKNIDRVIKDYNGEWNIENGAIIIKPKRVVKDSNDFKTLMVKKYTITDNLIKQITFMNDKNGKTDAAPSKRRGVKVSTFLLPIKLSYPITIDNEKYKGDYKVTSVRFNLDYRGNSWDVELETEAM